MGQPQKLVIVRHGETDWNKIAKACRTGKMEVPEKMIGLSNLMTRLSEEGIAQAVATGKALARIHKTFDGVYFSPWVRAVQTKELIFKQFSKKVRDDLEARSRPSLFIREQDPGKLDMLLGDPNEANRIYQEYRKIAMTKGHFRLKHGDVESWAQVGNRINLFIQRLKRMSIYDGKNLLIVTHGIALLLFRFILENLTEYEVEEINEHHHPENCGVYTYEWYPPGEKYVLTGCNETYYKKGLRKR